MDKSEYDRYGENPEIARKREETRKLFQEHFRDALLRGRIPDPSPIPAPQCSGIRWRYRDEESYTPKGFFGRWEVLTLDDCKFLFDCGIEVD